MTTCTNHEGLEELVLPIEAIKRRSGAGTEPELLAVDPLVVEGAGPGLTPSGTRWMP